MALRIIKAKPKVITQTIPEPWQTKARALFKFHPLFWFQYEIKGGNLEYRISLRNIYSRGKWVYEHFPFAAENSFPIRGLTGYSAERTWTELNLQVFQSLSVFVESFNPQKSYDNLLLDENGLPVWEQVANYISDLMEPLSAWFDFSVSIDDSILSYQAKQSEIRAGDTSCPGWMILKDEELHQWVKIKPVELAGMPIQEIEAECRELCQEKGLQHTNVLLEKTIMEKVVNSLYFMQLDVSHGK